MTSGVCPGCRAPASSGRFCPRCGSPLGTTLADYVARKGTFGPKQASVFGKRLLAVLDQQHAKGAVHGDLRPGTVVIQEGGRVAVAGGGESRSLPEPPSDPAEVGGGGGRWISPEQAVGRAAGVPSDLHAVGLLLHYVLTGESPWQASGGARLLFEIQRGLPPAPSSIRAGIPRALDEIVSRALSKRPEARYGSAAEMATALKALSGGAPTNVVSAAPALEEHSEDETVLGPLPVAGAASVPTPDRPPVPGDATIGSGLDSSGDETLAAPRPRRRPAPDETVTAPRPPRDETVTAPRPRQPAPDRTVAAPRRPAPDRTVRASRAPAAPDATVAAPRPPAAAAAPAPAGKRRGAWSVGGPVATFAITGALIVGCVYGFVWAGYLETIGWTVPPWLNRLVDRTNPVTVTAADELPTAALHEVAVQVELSPGTMLPLPGEPEDGRYGEWVVLRDPPAANGAEDTPAPAAWARGSLAGAPVNNVIPVHAHLPAGRYRVDVRTRFARGSTEVFAVGEDRRGRRDVRLRLVPDTGVLLVTVVPARATVTLVLPDGSRRERTGVGGEIVFGGGLPGSDDAPLPFGVDYTVRAEARGYDEASATVSPFLEPVHQVEFRLTRIEGELVDEAIAELERNDELSETFLLDKDLMAHKRMQAALARRAAEANAWNDVVSHLRQAERDVDPARPDLPPDARQARLGLHRHLSELAAAAAARGDVVAVRELAGQVRADLVPPLQAERIRADFAAHAVDAWLASLPAGEKSDDGEPLGDQFAAVRELVDERLPTLPEERRASLRTQVATAIVHRRAWPALYRVAEPAETDRTTAPRPLEARTAGWLDPARVARWLDLARRASPDIELVGAYRWLRARLVDIVEQPQEVVRWLLQPGWNPERAVSSRDVNLLLPEDKLMLARALRRWGDMREREGARDEAERLWDRSWTVYQRLTAEGLGVAQYVPSRIEAARVALLANRGPETARPLLEEAVDLFKDYLRVRGGEGEHPGDLLANLVDKMGESPPDSMGAAGLSMIPIPGGVFVTGVPTELTPADERSLGPGETVPVRSRSHDRWNVPAFWISEREVTWGQYKRYLRAMKDPANVERYRHPNEPREKRQSPDLRNPRVPLSQLADGDPVRGVDWWDAFACARFLGGRLPSRVEWEMAARWDGHTKPLVGAMAELRAAFDAKDLAWTEWWPATPADLGVLDRAPTGGRGFWGGVAEWTIDRFGVSSGDKLRRTVDLEVETMPLFGKREGESAANPVMAVRGGSYYHRAPGEGGGPSPVPGAQEWPEPAPAEPGAPAPGPKPQPPYFGDCDLVAERGIEAWADPPWIGFRVVYGPQAEK